MTRDDRAAVRSFFGERAARWDTRFPDDGPAFSAAVAALRLRPGDRVLDAGCGTGQALAVLREAVGPGGLVIGADLTAAMLTEAVRAGRRRRAPLLLADAARLPLRAGALDAVFAAGLVSHLPDPAAGLAELARVTRAGGQLALFHPVGRAALAARQGRELSARDVRARPRLEPLLAATGWRLTSYADEEARFLALARRSRPPAG
ncbi:MULTISPECIES: methyltransferase domain-containing protein [Streptomyces]|uniref:methyltransferase domain-containing protein n=1 Tax=Streptomyces TaxID=1883 RepID=UPI00224988BE|nr:methyltransferase domain-containing protein [Streptomyces sp. JHD 1]MCX2968441.1 methyltransferase domain-containing protein [Streptomyces sp. JHD 1]